MPGNRENIAQNAIVEAEHNATSVNPDFHTTNTDTNADNTATTTITSINQNKRNRRTRLLNNSSNPPEEQKKKNSYQPSTAQLSNTEIKLLSRGRTFVPTPKRINWSEIQADINDFARRLRFTTYDFARRVGGAVA